MALKRKRGTSRSSSCNSEDSDRDSESDLVPLSPKRHATPSRDLSSSASFVPSQLTRARTLPVLQCTVCLDPTNPRSQPLLADPVTLPCGHSICGSHISSLVAALRARSSGSSASSDGRRPPAGLTCPVAGCSVSTSKPVSVAPTLHPSSSVAIYPPIRPRTDNSQVMRVADVANLKSDIKVSRLLDLVRSRPEDAEDALPIRCDSDDDRARKRVRTFGTLQRSQDSVSPTGTRFTKAVKEVLTCEVCFMLYYEPMTLLCGHTFCAKCLQRTLDQDPKCPLCRGPLGGEVCYTLNMLDVRERQPPTNKALLGLLLLGFSKEYMARRQAMEDELAHVHLGGFDTPVYFLSEAIFPGMKTRLTFAQPAQRLMLRRILARPEPRFAVMLPPTDPNEGYGTVVSLRSVQFLHDNAAVAEAEGELRRFRLIETKLVDGYTVARVEMIDDCSDLEDSQSPPFSSITFPTPQSTSGPITTANLPLLEDERSIEDMVADCRKFIQDLGTDAAPWIVKKYNDEYGDQPPGDDPVAFGWWVASHLPLPHQDKAKLLAIRSPKLRLRLICHWISNWNDQWWYSRGCTIC